MLYMLGQAILDIKDNMTQKYLIKVGLSRKLTQRINTYKSDNPSAIVISTTAGVESSESKCHSFLLNNGELYSGEWYQVNKDFFNQCLKEGFKFFPKTQENQNIYMYPNSVRV